VRSVFVVVFSPSLQLFASVLQVNEPVSVQAFAAQLAEKRLDERIIGGFAKAAEVEDHTALLGLQIHVPLDEHAASVHPDRLR
tara:strand:+ start:1050 stop:1298 length:249 start_codon:yes stop_codon:yes gene_type:complete